MKTVERLKVKDSKTASLYWIQPRWGAPVYELRSENNLVGILRWSTHVGSDPALFISTDCEWKLTTDWWGWPHAVHVTNSDGDVALCKQNPMLSLARTFSVDFANGRRFRWRTNFWLTRAAFSDDDNPDWLVLRLVSIPQFKLKIQVDLVHGQDDFREAFLLAALGLYMWFATSYNGGFGWFGW